MKKLVLVFGLLLLFLSAIPQSFHIIYIRLDKTMNKVLVEQKLANLINGIENSSDTLVVLFSNSELITSNKKEVMKELNQYGTTFKNLGDLNYERAMLINSFPKNENGQPDFEKYSSVYFDVFVGDEFVAKQNKYNNDIFNRTLFVVYQPYINVSLNYYNTSNLTDDLVQYDGYYNLKNFLITLK